MWLSALNVLGLRRRYTHTRHDGYFAPRTIDQTPRVQGGRDRDCYFDHKNARTAAAAAPGGAAQRHISMKIPRHHDQFTEHVRQIGKALGDDVQDIPFTLQPTLYQK